MSACRSCGATVDWVATDRRKMPLDPCPDPKRGNVVRLSGDNALVLGHAEATERRARGDRLYLSHFATCPNADQHRKRNR